MSNAVNLVGYDNLLLAFNSLTSKQQKAQLRKSAKQSMKILQKEAKSTIRTITKKNGKRVKVRSLRKGVKLMGYKKKVGANVNLFGYYKLKWFETGTNLRHTGKRNTGKIKRGNFFNAAVNSKMNAVYDDFEKRVVDNIIKTFNRKYGNA